MKVRFISEYMVSIEPETDFEETVIDRFCNKKYLENYKLITEIDSTGIVIKFIKEAPHD